MTLILRTVRKARWLERPDWLAQGDLQADALLDLRTTNNTISVYRIEDDKSNLEQVVTALAANRDKIVNVDYALFDLQILTELDVKFEAIEGLTADATVNSWHFDLIELSARKLIDLGYVILKQAEIKRVPRKELISLVAKALKLKRINQTKLNEKVLKQIDPFLN